jgi:hypothetical protein
VAKLPENVTPLRRRKGRKVEVPDGIRLTVFIGPEHVQAAERAGDGNISKGIRDLIDKALNFEHEHERAI